MGIWDSFKGGWDAVDKLSGGALSDLGLSQLLVAFLLYLGLGLGIAWGLRRRHEREALQALRRRLKPIEREREQP